MAATAIRRRNSNIMTPEFSLVAIKPNLILDLFSRLVLRRRFEYYLRPSNFEGSVQHYYHFLLGFFVPLVIFSDKLRRAAPKSTIHVRSCALLDYIVHEARLENVVIHESAVHKEGIAFAHAHLVKDIALGGMDHPRLYDKLILQRATTIVKQRLEHEIRSEILAIEKGLSDHALVLIVRRAEEDPFYSSDFSEIKTAGATRRSIANHDELHHAISQLGANVISTTLEGKGLAHQIALFTTADIIVCQHGGALANLIWARPETVLIEINPVTLPDLIKRRRYFGRLAECLGMSYVSIDQTDHHSAVDVDRVAAAAQQALQYKSPEAPTQYFCRTKARR